MNTWMLCGFVHRYKNSGWRYVKTSTCPKCRAPACPTLCILDHLGDISMEMNSAHMVLTALCIAKKNYAHELETKK